MGEKVNGNHKDRLFTFIFGREENRKWTLSLYNAINGTEYTNEKDIEITTMSDTVYMGMKNDVSCIVSNTLNLYEHQSTYNPNMPLRQLMYLGRQYDRYIKDTGKNIYSSKQLSLPVPKLVTFYNGLEDVEDRVLKLSDSFPEKADESDVQVSVRLININPGKNEKLLDSCGVLREYSWFVEKVREYKAMNVTLEEAVDRAVDEMPKNYQIRSFLIKNRAEVRNMCLTEYNEAKTMQMFKEEGRKEGIKEGKVDSIRNLMHNLNISAEQAMVSLGIPKSEHCIYMKLL